MKKHAQTNYEYISWPMAPPPWGPISAHYGVAFKKGSWAEQITIATGQVNHLTSSGPSKLPFWCRWSNLWFRFGTNISPKW